MSKPLQTRNNKPVMKTLEYKKIARQINIKKNNLVYMRRKHEEGTDVLSSRYDPWRLGRLEIEYDKLLKKRDSMLIDIVDDSGEIFIKKGNYVSLPRLTFAQV